MKNFLAIYLGSAASREAWDKLPEAERKKREQDGMAGWRAWMEKNKASLVEAGGPLGKTKRASKQGIADVRNSMGAFCIVRAESHEAAARMFENHPHFMIFPGDAVEIMECLPIPGQ
jgi:leucyl aminopeptidase (aminopeptidase T)